MPVSCWGGTWGVIQTPKLELRIMRYELSHHEWDVINPMLPNKPVAFPVLTTARPKRHLLDLGLGRPLARPAGDFWSPHDLLQSLRSLAAG
jgi:hypothetical protein